MAFSEQSSTIVPDTYNLEAMKRHLANEKSLQLLKVSTSNIRLDMEQFVLVPAYVYNKSLNTQSVTKQELPK